MMFIYTLIDPRTKQIRYVGKTNDLKRRLYMHIYWAKKKLRNQYVMSWINQLLGIDLLPIIKAIEENLSEEKAIEREIHWIKKLKDDGCPLTNLNAGGLGFGLNNKVWFGRKHTQATKDKMSKKSKGRVWSVASRINHPNVKGKKPGISDYRSKNNKTGNLPSIKIIVLDAITSKELHRFTSVLECSKVLNLNRSYIMRSMKSGKPYTKYKFKIDGKETTL